MTELRHTPAPWVVTSYSGNPLKHWENQPRGIQTEDGEAVCAFPLPPDKDAEDSEQIREQRSNDAFWIAHVPELVEAVRGLKEAAQEAKAHGEELSPARVLATLKKIPV